MKVSLIFALALVSYSLASIIPNYIYVTTKEPQPTSSCDRLFVSVLQTCQADLSCVKQIRHYSFVFETTICHEANEECEKLLNCLRSMPDIETADTSIGQVRLA